MSLSGPLFSFWSSNGSGKHVGSDDAAAAWRRDEHAAAAWRRDEQDASAGGRQGSRTASTGGQGCGTCGVAGVVSQPHQGQVPRQGAVGVGVLYGVCVGREGGGQQGDSSARPRGGIHILFSVFQTPGGLESPLACRVPNQASVLHNTFFTNSEASKESFPSSCTFSRTPSTGT